MSWDFKPPTNKKTDDFTDYITIGMMVI